MLPDWLWFTLVVLLLVFAATCYVAIFLDAIELERAREARRSAAEEPA